VTVNTSRSEATSVACGKGSPRLLPLVFDDLHGVGRVLWFDHGDLRNRNWHVLNANQNAFERFRRGLKF